MKLSQVAGLLSIGAAALSGCSNNPETLTCEEIRTEISRLQQPDKFPAATFEGAVVRKASKDTRTQALKATAYDKGCANNSSDNRD